ncbi:hypothetical protein ES705_13416 [subsurface metagenome]
MEKREEKTRIKSASSDNPSTPNQEEAGSYLYYSVNGYLATGNSVVIKGEKCELVEPVGSFGYIVEHDGEVDGWVDDIEGAEKVDENTYVLEIPPGTVAEIITRIKPIKPPSLSLSLHGGPNFPLSNFANDYGMGFNVMADIGYEINRSLLSSGIIWRRKLERAPGKPALRASLKRVTAVLTIL